MNKHWSKINMQIYYFLEYNSLPNLLASTIAYMYYNNYKCKNFDYLYNNIKNYINTFDIDKKGVIILTKNILKNKYHLKIVKYNPLIIKEVD